MSDNASTNISLLEFGGFTVPAGCRRVFITAELEASNGDPRIQPTGFPDIGPVLYPDPNPDKEKNNGLICLIESEASMANRLEEVCLADRYTGKLKAALRGLPYIELTDTGSSNGRFMTASTIDGHRFASEYIMASRGRRVDSSSSPSMASFGPDNDADSKTDREQASAKTQKPAGKKGGDANGSKPEFVAFVRDYLGMSGTDKCPAANVPNIFVLAMEYDPLSLIHGFQISVKRQLTFVGLRSPRALTASIVGLNCERLIVPGIRFDPIGTGDAGQAIFQKQRVTAGRIEARFSIDVGLLASLRLVALQQNGNSRQNDRLRLLAAIALWKVASFLDQGKFELSLRTECKLRLKGKPKFEAEGLSRSCGDFPYETIAATSLADAGQNESLIAKAAFQDHRSPLVLKFTKSKESESVDAQRQSGAAALPAA